MSKDNGGAVATIDPGAIMEAVIAKGDLSKLTPSERALYYRQTCESMGLNPFTQPFEYITLQGKLTLYARRAAADQLRKVHGVTLVSLDRRYDAETEMYEVSARMRDRDGREDEDISAVHIGKLQGDARGNAMKKAVTQAKRRCTLSLCGLGWLDETEIEQIPDARRVPMSSYVPDDEPSIDITEAEYQIDQLATSRQVKFLVALARDRGLADRQLEKMVNERFSVPVKELTRRQASQLIDEITAMPEVIDAESGEIVSDDNTPEIDAESPVGELLARTYAATNLDELEAIRKEKNDNGINDETLADAWRVRFRELGGKSKQPELVGAAAGEAGADKFTS